MTINKYNEIITYLRGLIETSEFNGHVYSVGGCERDKNIKRDIKDIDIVIDFPNGGINFAKWLETIGVLKGTVVTYENFGTAMFKLKAYPEDEIEVVHTRKECYRDENSRNPETEFGTLKDDCFRRDFTINSLYHNISTGEDIDPTGKGLSDIKNRIISTCDDPDIIFKEDPLRIMRAVRQSCQLGFSISYETTQGIKKNVNRLSIISQERITEELTKIILSMKSREGLLALKELGIIDVIAPELISIDFFDVYKKLLNFDPYNNDIKLKGTLALMINSISLEKQCDFLKRFKFSNKVINDVIFINKYVYVLGEASYKRDDKKIRTIQYLCNDDNEKFFYLLRVARSILNVKYAEEKYGMLFFNWELPVNGNDVMNYTDAKGAEVGKMLDKLLDIYLENPSLTKDDLIRLMCGCKIKIGLFKWLKLN